MVDFNINLFKEDKIMITKKILTILLAATLSFAPCAKLYSTTPEDMSSMNISPEQLQEMQEFAGQVFDNLSDEDREKLQQELNEEVAKFNAMDEAQKQAYLEEKTKEVEEAFGQMEQELAQLAEQEGLLAEPEATPTEDQKEKKKKEEKRAKQEKKENKKKLEKLVKTIKQIVEILNSFENKLKSMEKPSAKEVIDELISKKWAGANSTYNTFKKDLDTMKEKIKKLQDNQTTYLVNVKYTEKLSGQLEQLLKTIKKYEPKVQIIQSTDVATGEESQTLKDDTAENALQQLVSHLVDTTEEISANIDELVNKYAGKNTIINTQDEPDYSTQDIQDIPDKK